MAPSFGFGSGAMSTMVTERWSLSVAEMSRSAGYAYAPDKKSRL
ncbi:MAG: hypothetical protein RM022_003520 [Nostoc sp. EfeVER01]|nr:MULTISPECIES: hypothetical protein [unclassified Nostoc]MDZ7946950.1 hypothetical protein [Nostoc sp. EfeVER01]MDZ7993338.1 hypothetical protein [Nostoc sp. EspVER01]